MDWYRYAETHGSQEDPAIAHSQEYKNYLIRALNNDISYKQLLQEHIAGDLLPQPRINQAEKINESAIGPAHFRMNIYSFGPTDAHGELLTTTDNQIDVLSKAMLGVTVSCARCHDHKFDPVSQADFFRMYGILTSNRMGNEIISTADVLDKNKSKLLKLKTLIRRELADYWLKSKPNFSAKAVELFSKPADMKTDEAKAKLEEQKLYGLNSHPVNALSLLNHPQLKGELVKIKQALDRARVDNESIRQSASYYLDFRQSSKDKHYFVEGNSTADKVSPAGNFAVNYEGDELIQGIYASGFFSHLLSDKHVATFSSHNFKVEDKGLWVKSMGHLSSMKPLVRNYPLDHSPLHKASILRNDQWAWNDGNIRTNYWEGEQMHLELRTSGQAIIGQDNNHPRSWFGVSELIVAARKPHLIGASLVDLYDPAKINNKNDLLLAYRKVLGQALKAWKSKVSRPTSAIYRCYA